MKSNRLVSSRKETGYQALDSVAPPPGGWSTGLEVRLKQVPFAVRLFKLVASNSDIEWGVTNNFAFTLTQQLVEATTRMRWLVERVAPQLQTAHRDREVPMPVGPGPAQPFGLLLPGLGFLAPVCPANSADYLPGPAAAVDTLPAPTAGKTPLSRLATHECVSPIGIKVTAGASLSNWGHNQVLLICETNPIGIKIKSRDIIECAFFIYKYNFQQKCELMN